MSAALAIIAVSIPFGLLWLVIDIVELERVMDLAVFPEMKS